MTAAATAARTADVAVVGGGPAGAAVAWRLATAGAAVALVHDHRDRWRPVGQQVPSAARPLLQAMGVLDDVTAGSVAVHEARSAWPGPRVDARPALLSPFGPPLAVERPRLDALLRAAARRAGARVVHGHARATRCPPGEPWLLTSASERLRAPVLIDATGTTRAVSRTRLPWTHIDRLRCTLWKAAPADPAPQPWSLVETAPDGWWYTAPRPDEGLTVMRVGDLPGTDGRPDPPEHTARRLGRPLPAATGYRVAAIGHASPPWSPGLLAVGDAAVAVDPLSSSGLHHALRLAEPAAAAALGLLNGDTGPARRYARDVAAVADEHQARRHHYLAQTGGHEPFWSRRTAQRP